MFNTSHYNAGNHTNNIKINAVTGAILKNHPKSWFERFHLKSKRAEQLLDEHGHHTFTVLQMVVCGDMEVMAELVYTKDYETSLSDDA